MRNTLLKVINYSYKHAHEWGQDQQWLAVIDLCGAVGVPYARERVIKTPENVIQMTLFCTRTDYGKKRL